MNVGLPGTGIGGLFYLLNVWVLVGIELWRLINGQFNKTRWTENFKLMLLTVVIYGSILMMGWIFFKLISWMSQLAPNQINTTQISNIVGSNSLLIILTSPLLFLTGLVIIVQIMSLWAKVATASTQ